MDTISFQALIGPDAVIRPPAGVQLPAGTVEVTVRPVSVNNSVDQNSNSGATLEPDSKSTRERLLAIIRQIEREAPGLPRDLAENHDFYAHGKPRE